MGAPPGSSTTVPATWGPASRSPGAECQAAAPRNSAASATGEQRRSAMGELRLRQGLHSSLAEARARAAWTRELDMTTQRWRYSGKPQAIQARIRVLSDAVVQPPSGMLPPLISDLIELLSLTTLE